MKVALILLNYNGRAYLPDLFASLGEINFPPEAADVFFIDNASTDDSLAWAQQHEKQLNRRVYFIANTHNLGFAKAHNVVFTKIITEGGYDFVALLNVDTIVDKEWLGELINAVKSERESGAIQSLIMLAHDNARINTAGNVLHFLGFGWVGQCGKTIEEAHVPSTPYSIGYASGAAVVYPLSVLKRVGLFEEEFFMYHEDLELSWRIRRAGYRIVCAPRSRIFHKYHFSRHKKKWYWVERNRLFTYASLYKIPTLVLFAPAWFLVECAVLMGSVFEGWFFDKLKSYGDFLRLVPAMVKKRKNLRALRLVRDKEILAAMQGTFQGAPFSSPGLSFVINPFLRGYWFIVRRLIFW